VLSGDAMKIAPGVVLLAIGLATPVEAQVNTVAGIVIDDRTEQPIKGVAVYVEGQSTIVETDADGRFSLMAPRGRQTLAASVIGYALLRTDIEVGDAALDMTIRLSEGAGAYTERVNVSGSLRSDSESVAGSTSLFGRELETLRGAVLDDPLRAVQSLPSATATDDFYSEFAVRGNPFRYVGLVVDGVPSRYLMHAVNGISDGGSIAMINSETLGSVSLLPGSYPQRTGRQLGGEVDLATREGSRDEFRGRAGLSGTSLTFLGEGPIASGKGSWLASIRRSYLDYLIKRIDPEAGFAFGFVDAQGKAVYDLSPRHQVSFTALWAARCSRKAIRTSTSTRFDRRSAARGCRRCRGDIFRARSWRSRSVCTRPACTSTTTTTRRRRSTLRRFTKLGWRADGSFSPADAPRHRVRWRRRASRRPQSHRQADRPGEYPGHAEQLRRACGGWLGVRTSTDRSWLTSDGDARRPHRPLDVDPIDHGLAVDQRRAAPVRAYAPARRQRRLSTVSGFRRGARHPWRRTRLEPERALHLDAGIEQRLPGQTRVLFNVYARRERDVLWTPGA
jgi:hypothetical protein